MKVKGRKKKKKKRERDNEREKESIIATHASAPLFEEERERRGDGWCVKGKGFSRRRSEGEKVMQVIISH